MSLARKIASLFGTGATIDPTLVIGVKPGVMFPYGGAVAPSDTLFCFGQAVSRTTYDALFAAIGTAHGVGDGSTTFNLPDMRGRTAAGKDDMGGTAANRLNVTLTGTKASTASGSITSLSSTAALSIGMRAFGTGIGTNAVVTAITSGTAVTLSVNSTTTGSTSIRFAVVDGATLGAVGGSQTHALVTAQMPGHTHTQTGATLGSGSQYANVGDGQINSGGETASTGGGQSHPTLPPTIVLNYIIKT